MLLRNPIRVYACVICIDSNTGYEVQYTGNNQYFDTSLSCSQCVNIPTKYTLRNEIQQWLLLSIDFSEYKYLKDVAVSGKSRIHNTCYACKEKTLYVISHNCLTIWKIVNSAWWQTHTATDSKIIKKCSWTHSGTSL